MKWTLDQSCAYYLHTSYDEHPTLSLSLSLFAPLHPFAVSTDMFFCLGLALLVCGVGVWGCHPGAHGGLVLGACRANSRDSYASPRGGWGEAPPCVRLAPSPLFCSNTQYRQTFHLLNNGWQQEQTSTRRSYCLERRLSGKSQ